MALKLPSADEASLFKVLKLLALWYGLGTVLSKQKAMNRKNKADKTRKTNAAVAGDNSNAVKNPDEWTTGDEEMTGAQKSYLNTLAQEAGENVKEDLTKAEASKKIDELQHKTGRGLDH